MYGFIHIYADTQFRYMHQNHSHIPFHQNVCHVVFHKEKEISGYKVHPNPHNFEKQMPNFKYIMKPAFHRGYEGDHNCSHTFSLFEVSEYSLLIFLKSSYCRLSRYQLMVGMMCTCTLYDNQLEGEIILFIKCADRIQSFCIFLDYTAFLV